ncbi:hypothetical protein BDV11DRAFT_169147 [Aspergillus similis]
MASQHVAAQGMSRLEAQPQLPEYPAQPNYPQMSTRSFIEEHLDRSQASRLYQLESRLREEHGFLQQERQHSSRLEQRLASLQWTQSQLESALSRTRSDVGRLRQELDIQTRKSQDAESRAAALASLNTSLLEMLVNTVSEGAAQAKPMHIVQIYSDIQKHSESIETLRRSNRYLEESFEGLQAAFQAALYDCSFSGSACSSDSKALTEQKNSVGDAYSSELPTRGDRESMHSALGSLPLERSWYEE